MISVIFCSRVKDNPDSALERLLDSAVMHIAPEERDQIEFLIKYDDDDEQRPPDSFFDAIPSRFAVSSGRAARGGIIYTTPRNISSPSAIRARASV